MRQELTLHTHLQWPTGNSLLENVCSTVDHQISLWMLSLVCSALIYLPCLTVYHILCYLEKLHILCKSNPKLNLSILRIYNRAVEMQDFPGPDNTRGKESEYNMPCCAPKYTLHHKIRLTGSKLIEYEKKFQDLPPGSILNGKTYREYRQALVEAENKILTEHFDIILCTCSESSSSRVLRCIFPRQCIVDECGMASEPECITPLQLCEHVVLIGDHKQLQPVITHKAAAERGLSTSLFQRYAEKFEGEHIKRLTIQYRMVSLML